MIFGWFRKKTAQPGRDHLVAGEWGEQEAARMLAAKGYRILGRRVRIGRRDEIDLVARDGETLVFVEVKTRKSEGYGRPFSAVDRHKRYVLSRGAVRYLLRLKTQPAYFRFDVVEVIGSPDGAAPTVRHIEHAFTMDPRYRLP